MIELRNELRAKQVKLSGDEIRCAIKIQQLIVEQGILEQRIKAWDIAIARTKAEEAVKTSEGS